MVVSHGRRPFTATLGSWRYVTVESQVVEMRFEVEIVAV